MEGKMWSRLHVYKMGKRLRRLDFQKQKYALMQLCAELEADFFSKNVSQSDSKV